MNDSANSTSFYNSKYNFLKFDNEYFNEISGNIGKE